MAERGLTLRGLIEEAMYEAVEKQGGMKVADAWGDMEYFVASEAAARVCLEAAAKVADEVNADAVREFSVGNSSDRVYWSGKANGSADIALKLRRLLPAPSTPAGQPEVPPCTMGDCDEPRLPTSGLGLCRAHAEQEFGGRETSGTLFNHVTVAAYMTDRADQYPTKSPCWVALTDVASDVMNGAVEAAEKHGELDDDLKRRVSRWNRTATTGSGAP